MSHGIRRPGVHASVGGRQTKVAVYVTTLLVLCAAGCIVWRAATPRPTGPAVPLSREVRPGGGWLENLGQQPVPVMPDTRFLDFPDGEERRINEPGSPLHGQVTLTRVRMTDISLYRSDKEFGRVTRESMHGRHRYWAVESKDAYVYPDSTPKTPHVLPYTRIGRFMAEEFTPEEIARREHDDAATVADALRQYRQADAAMELRLALQAGDRRFVGVMGIGLLVPGTRYPNEPAIETHGVKLIPYTSDALSSDDDLAFNDVAHRYAESYNRLLLKALAGERDK